ncbi:hypothetical protein M9H77_25484 [Catharanthus roseus]|uniref:Uncharacterized protein n=1 Tax=Catharanthus roseus TaxID=4058 RepID=A0ACC0A7X4_CATRO|nr:hypothetical protein M9H77_25484 [Catharanthus roseus]
MQCYSRAPRTTSESQHEVIGTKVRHLVVITSQTPYERLIAKQLLFPYHWSKQVTDSWGTYQHLFYEFSKEHVTHCGEYLQKNMGLWTHLDLDLVLRSYKYSNKKLFNI